MTGTYASMRAPTSAVSRQGAVARYGQRGAPSAWRSLGRLSDRGVDDGADGERDACRDESEWELAHAGAEHRAACDEHDGAADGEQGESAEDEAAPNLMARASLARTGAAVIRNATGSAPD
jgi:hypothetical protein